MSGGDPVVIVGAGPAGCAAAIALRARGAGVLLVDRAAFPRDKVCGDVLLPAALDEIRALGLDTAPLRARGGRCAGARYVAPSGREFSGAFPGEGWLILERRIFDAWLVGAAVAAGAELREGVEVTGLLRDASGRVRGVACRTGTGGPGRLAAAVVIGADGASSAVARSARGAAAGGDGTAIAVRGYAGRIRRPSAHAEIFTSAEILPGCAWIVPTGGGGANVGAGLVRKDANRRGVRAAGLIDHLKETLPAFGERLAGAEIGPPRGWTLPLAPGAGRGASGDGWLLAGDAAALIDPLTGHGIHTALRSGRGAGGIVADGIEAGDLSGAYLARYDREVVSPLLRAARPARWMQRLHGRALFSEALALAGGRSARLRSMLLGLVGHTGPRRPARGGGA